MFLSFYFFGNHLVTFKILLFLTVQILQLNDIYFILNGVLCWWHPRLPGIMAAKSLAPALPPVFLFWPFEPHHLS